MGMQLPCRNSALGSPGSGPTRGPSFRPRHEAAAPTSPATADRRAGARVASKAHHFLLRVGVKDDVAREHQLAQQRHGQRLRQSPCLLAWDWARLVWASNNGRADHSAVPSCAVPAPSPPSPGALRSAPAPTRVFSSMKGTRGAQARQEFGPPNSRIGQGRRLRRLQAERLVEFVVRDQLPSRASASPLMVSSTPTSWRAGFQRG